MICRLAKKIRVFFFRLLNSIIPKDGNLYLFMSLPDFSESPRTLYEYMKKSDPKSSLIWLVWDEKVAKHLKEKGVKVEVFPRVKSVVYLFRAKTIITSHNQLINYTNKKQKYIALWHGIPLKKIGFMDADENTDTLKKAYERISVMPSTSGFTKTILNACFQLDESKIVVSGLPRNDSLFNPLENADLQALLGIDASAYDKIVLFMPTFRQGYMNRTEGKPVDTTNIFRFSFFDNTRFLDFLRVNRILFLSKFHPFEQHYLEKLESPNSNNYLMIRSETLRDSYTDLYRLVGRADLLITDYSSVFFDYLLTDKPLLFVPTDLNEYTKNRGFLLEPYLFWTPGPKVQNQDELEEEILKSLNTPSYYKIKREEMKSIIHTQTDGKSSERLAAYIRSAL